MKFNVIALFIAVYSIGINQLTAQSANRPTREELMNGTKSIENILDKPFIFTKGELNVSGNDVTNKKAFKDAILKSDLVIKEYDQEVTKFLASNPNPSTYNNKLNNTINKASGLTSQIDLTEKEFKQGTSLGGIYYLQKLYLYKGYLEGVTRIYKDNQKLNNYLTEVTNAINKYGSRDKFLDKLEENQKNYIQNLRMIPAMQSNQKIEALVKKKYEEFESKFTVTKVNIIDPSWRIEKNDLGIPLNRKLSVSIGLKNNSGECGVAEANVMEEYQGGGTYGEAFMYLPTNVIVVPCKNLQP